MINQCIFRIIYPQQTHLKYKSGALPFSFAPFVATFVNVFHNLKSKPRRHSCRAATHFYPDLYRLEHLLLRGTSFGSLLDMPLYTRLTIDHDGIPTAISSLAFLGQSPVAKSSFFHLKKCLIGFGF
jgi:hypothetical protein